MINWFDMPAEGLSNGGLFEVKELEVTENGTYETKGEMYNKVTVNVPSPTGKITITENGTGINVAQYATADVNVEGGGGSSDFSTATMTLDTGDRFKVAGAFITPDGTTTFSGTNFADGDYQLILYKGTGEVFMENWDSELFAITGNITMPLPATGVVTGDFKISYIGE